MHKLHWLNLPAGLLIALLQRAPVLRVVAAAEEIVVAPRAGLLLKSVLATAASLGAVQTLAGATVMTFRQGSAVTNPVNATVGTALSAVGATVTGAGVGTVGSWDFSNNLPPGLTVTGASVQGNLIVLNGNFFTITGTPRTSGTYPVTIHAWENPNLRGNKATATLTFNVTGGTLTTPTFTTQPASQTAVIGTTVTFSVVAVSGATVSYQWQKNGAAIAGAISPTLTLPNVQLANAGAYTVQVTNSAGSSTSNAATLTVTAPVGTPPAIALPPQSVTVNSGDTVALIVGASGTAPLRYQWHRDGQDLPGETGGTLMLSNTTTGDAAGYTVTVSNGAGAVTSAAAMLTVTSGGSSRLSNLSVRTSLPSGQLLTVGFVTTGEKPILMRGVGPGMHDVFPQFFAMADVFADPLLELFNPSSIRIDLNDNWANSLSATFASVGAFPLTPGSKDAALLDAVSGPHTAQFKGTGSGVALVEVYDTTTSFSPRLSNVSARNQVGTGANILIAGFVIDGDVGRTVLIRGIGPALKDVFKVSGELADPKLEIYNASGVKLAENDNWDASLVPYFDWVGAYRFVAGSKDAALLVTLPPGIYTAQISGVGGTTGDGVVEVYDLQVP